MPLEDMAARLVGWVPRLPKEEAYNIVNDAWRDIRNSRTWSFQLFEDSYTTPNQITAGTFTTTLGVNTVTADSTASAAVTGLINPLLTQRQFRVQGFTIYNIIAADFTIPSAVVLTLDRNYADPTGTGLPYQIFQAYVAAPFADFKRWIVWRDMFNGEWLDVHSTRREIDIGDPQRLYYSFPHWVVGMGVDNRGAGTSTPSITLGYPMHELYPNPLQQIPYMRWGVRLTPDLVNPSDTVPYPMTEKMVSARARMLAYQMAEANRDPTIPRGQAADYKFLYASAGAELKLEMCMVGKVDRDITDTYLARLVRDSALRKLPYYSTIIGRAYGAT